MGESLDASKSGGDVCVGLPTQQQILEAYRENMNLALAWKGEEWDVVRLEELWGSSPIIDQVKERYPTQFQNVRDSVVLEL
ncbi:MAG TPA: hypothetical protein PK957_03230 [Candidatus Dojkabacteria bacterium]|nr:hypothetical protein [Candidatus Dojkabacteria bacterium]HQF37094.1 hypothetical protein [Candidatus Dojkabacteria bacterium]